MSDLTKLTIVTDSHSESVAVYILGTLRAQVDFIDEFTPSLLIECYEMYARNVAVVIEHATIDSDAIGLWDDDAAEVQWPSELWSLAINV